MSASESSGLQIDKIFSLANKKLPTAAQPAEFDFVSSDPSKEETEREDEENVILCILFKNCKMAASYYKINEKLLYVLNEVVDLQPEYASTRSLLREIRPLHVVTLGNPCEKFIKSLIGMVNEQEATCDSDQIRSVPKNMSLLTFKEYTYHNCEYRVKSLRLMSEAEGVSDEEHELYLHSLINFQLKLSVHSLGALIKFTEKSWAHLNGSDNDPLNFHHIYQISLADHVFIDATTFSALQIFQTTTHDASFKHGRVSTSRESVSLFKLFSQHCKSKLGYIKTKNVMLKPLKNVVELNKRLDFMDFVLNPKNLGFVEALQDNIKNIADINMILVKIQHSRGTANDWATLYRSIYNVLFLNEMCAPYRECSVIFCELANCINENLYGLQQCIDNVLEFKSTTKTNRPIVRGGLDSVLDQNKLIREDIGKRVNVAAKIVVEQLPAFLDECTVFYIPDMGHVVAVNKWEPMCDRNELQNYGFQYMFELNNFLHYKNALCQELDRQLGDVQTDILDHENRIIERLAAFVLKYSHNIREPMQVIALIDCLISMAKVANEKGFVRPQLNENNIHEITDGRHPLLELTNSLYVCNEFYSGGTYRNMKIITGPNSSGKSVYLKQTALLIYLAHIGSFVPAKKANIAMVHSIHSRMHATESAILNLSAFMIDLTQMSQALYNAKPTSLILMDEFGRGTTGREGLALLMGALRKFLAQDQFCPHVLVSTHLHLDTELLDNSLIQYQKMQHTQENNEFVFLYKVIDGVSSSYALEIAASVELDVGIVKRAKNILEDFKNVVPVGNIIPRGYNVDYYNVDLEFLEQIEIPEFDDLAL